MQFKRVTAANEREKERIMRRLRYSMYRADQIGQKVTKQHSN